MKKLEDLPGQYLGLLKTRKIGFSWRLSQDRKMSDWSETFCKTPTRWIENPNCISIWWIRLGFG
jgi:hypothetical protein